MARLEMQVSSRSVTGFWAMAGDMDPVRPIHPSWPGRPVPEEGDAHKRHRAPRGTHDEEEWGERDSEHQDPAQDAEIPAGGPTGRRRPSPDDDIAGHHVDDYA